MQTLTHQLVPTWVLQFWFFLFFWFSQCFLGFWPKVLKTSRNPKKTKKKNKIADPNSPACTYMGLAILVFFVFLVFSMFFGFLTKSIKNLEKSKKNKKNKIADPNSPACTYMGLAILVFFVFLVFSMFFGFLTKSIKNLEKSKKNKKKKQNCRP